LIQANLIVEPIKNPITNEILDPKTEVVKLTNNGENNYTYVM
jgi:hypothetical protein